MVVLRMLAQNSDQDQRSGGLGVQEPRNNPSDQRAVLQDQRLMQQEPRPQVPTESRESLKFRTLQVSRVVVNVKESSQIVEEMLRVGEPVGLDGEGVNLGPKGKISLKLSTFFKKSCFIFTYLIFYSYYSSYIF